MRAGLSQSRCLIKHTRFYSVSLRPKKQPRAAMAAPPQASHDGYANPASEVPHVEAAWAWFNAMGAPKYWVAPMVDQSELPFRLLCKRHGATASYTPMLHARLFVNGAPYRAEHFNTIPSERPVLAQFCANDPDILLAAAKFVEPHVDGVDVNLGCPQRIAKKGNYGAYLMDNLPLVEAMVRRLARDLAVPVTVKIRRFDDVSQTVAYAAMLERAGASMVAIHGRTRDQKKTGGNLACWETIAAVKKALRVPVLANGNIQTMHDVEPCLRFTGADGVLSAESLLADPALFSPKRLLPGGEMTFMDGPSMLLEYLELCEQHPVPFRMVKGHAFKLLGPWLTEFIDMRDMLNRPQCGLANIPTLQEFTRELIRRAEATGRSYPIAQISAKKLAKMEADAAREAAIAEQQREEEAMNEIEGAGNDDKGEEEGERPLAAAAAAGAQC